MLRPKVSSAPATAQAASTVLRGNGYVELACQLDEHDRARCEDLAVLQRRVDQVLTDRDVLALQLELLCDAVEPYLIDRLSEQLRRLAADAIADVVDDAR